MPRKNFCNRGLAGNTYHSRDACGFLFDARHIVLIWCASVRRRNSPYFAESSPDWSSRALIYPRLRASSRLYEKRRPGFAFPCYARRGEDEELGGCVDGGNRERQRGILLYVREQISWIHFCGECAWKRRGENGSSAGEMTRSTKTSGPRIADERLYLFKIDIYVTVVENQYFSRT